VDDILVLYTDGVTEASRDGELFGDERLESVVMRQPVGPESLPQLILAQVLAFSHGTLRDDVAVLAVSLREVAGNGSRPRADRP
jgi:phosphoserine phosphatase RsbU/P